MTTETKPVRFREVKDTPVKTLLNSLTIEQIRNIISRLDIQLNSDTGKTRESLIDGILSSGRDSGSILNCSYEIESLTPFKHFIFFFYYGEISSTPSSFSTHFSHICKNVPTLKHTYFKVTPEIIYITMEHQVEVFELEEIHVNTFTRVTHLIRHPICARLYRNNNTLIITYPGFSQGKSIRREDKLLYENVISDVLTFLEELVKIKAKSPPIRLALDKLAEIGSSEIKRIQICQNTAQGNISIKSRQSGLSAEELFVNCLGESIDRNLKKQLMKEFQNNLSSNHVDSMILLWNSYNLVTRVAFWRIGAELLFIWNKSSHNYSKCMDIINSLINVSVDLVIDGPSMLKISEHFKPGEIIFTEHVINIFGGSPTEIRDILISAAQVGLLLPIFKIKTNEVLLDYCNDWTPDLLFLRRTFITESNEEIDGSLPSNIEVAFKRSISSQESNHAY